MTKFTRRQMIAGCSTGYLLHKTVLGADEAVRSKEPDPFKGLEPAALWRHFENFTRIARPSKSENQMIQYIKGWATSRQGADVSADKAGNLRVAVPATAGRERAAIVILQGHLDMVCLRDGVGEYDPSQGRIRVYRASRNDKEFVENPNGEWIKADKTTLGADDGIGVAAMLCIAEDLTAPHGPLELLFTVDEETGLTGASQLDPSILKGRICLNLDSEDDGLLTIGSAGGRIITITWERPQVDMQKNQIACSLDVRGLLSGHSGVDIDKGRLNAIRALALILHKAVGVGLQLASISGGFPSNAIPKEASCVVVMPMDSEMKFMDAVSTSTADLKKQYNKTEPHIQVVASRVAKAPSVAYTIEDTRTLVEMIHMLPTGVIRMSRKLPGLVETSNNVGGIRSLGNKVTIECSPRSSVAKALEGVAQTVMRIAAFSNASVGIGEPYAGWDPDPQSPVLKSVVRSYIRLNGLEPRISAVHAGLECGIIKGKIPGLDAVSFGPTIYGAHTLQEAVNLASVKKFYNLLKAVVADLSV
jgi:dipeptidase D